VIIKKLCEDNIFFVIMLLRNSFFTDISKKKLSKISPYLNERQRRIVYAAEAEQLGCGGKSLICTTICYQRLSLFVVLPLLSLRWNVQKSRLLRSVRKSSSMGFLPL